MENNKKFEKGMTLRQFLYKNYGFTLTTQQVDEGAAYSRSFTKKAENE